ncbi:hypothetical protein GW750_04100 [bacterium]|nr:hypothetical protein [bacterium]
MSSSDPKLTVACFQSVLPGAAVTGIADPYFMKSVATYALEHNIAFVP